MDLPGRGRALRAIWSQSDAEVLAYMDVDLSTDLNALLPLVAPLLSGHSDLAIGTRLARGSRVIRGPKRELISRSYNLLLRTLMGLASQTRDAASRPSGATRRGRCCRSPRTPARSSTPNCSCWPNAPGCASMRSPWTGSTTSTRASTSSPRPWPTYAEWPGSASVRARVHPGSPAARPGPGRRQGPSVADRQVHGHRGGRHGRLRGAVPGASRDHVGPGGQPGQPRRDGVGQHRREPAADIPHQRPDERGQAPGQGPDRVRHRARPDLGCAGRPGADPSRPDNRGHGAHRRQPGGHRHQVRAAPALGVRQARARARRLASPGPGNQHRPDK